MKKNLKIKGFTLVELLVVVAIIAILTAIVMANLLSSKTKARDAKRVSDIGQLQLALEQGFDKCQRYPAVTTLDVTSSVCTGVVLGDFISVVPKDPITGLDYGYYRKTSGGKTIDYVLKATLENSANGLDRITSVPSGFSGFTCSANTDYCVTSK